MHPHPPPTPPTPTSGTTRFNLICHGLMVYWQNRAKKSLSILIPDEPGHLFKMGPVDKVDGTAATAGLRDFSAGPVQLCGVLPSAMTTRDLLEAFELPVLRQSLLYRTLDERNEVVVPMPDEVRGYCGSDLDAAKYIGSTPRVLFLKLPTVAYDVIVLTWKQADPSVSGFFLLQGDRRVDARTEIIEKKNNGIVVETNTFLNLCLFAEPPRMDGGLQPNHGRTLNGVMKLRSMSLDLHPMLAGVVPDGAPEDTAIGVSTNELESLMVLEEQPRTTDETGCIGDVVIDDDDLSKY